jgi:DivIVA domain-containing protein
MSPGDPRFHVLTADDVRATTFNRSQLGWRGYSEEEVEAFVARVADGLVAADQERAALRAEIRRLRDFYRSHQDDVDRVDPTRHRHRVGDDELVTAVADYAEVQVDQAREYALLLDRGDAGAPRMLHHARVRAELATDEALEALGRQGVGERSLDRALMWLGAFGDALRVQLDVTTEVLLREQTRFSEWQAASPPPSPEKGSLPRFAP